MLVFLFFVVDRSYSLVILLGLIQLLCLFLLPSIVVRLHLEVGKKITSAVVEECPAVLKRECFTAFFVKLSFRRLRFPPDADFDPRFHFDCTLGSGFRQKRLA